MSLDKKDYVTAAAKRAAAGPVRNLGPKSVAALKDHFRWVKHGHPNGWVWVPRLSNAAIDAAIKYSDERPSAAELVAVGLEHGWGPKAENQGDTPISANDDTPFFRMNAERLARDIEESEPEEDDE